MDLTNSFLPENRAGTVPVFVVLDSSMGEVARFIETAHSLVPAIDAMDDAWLITLAVLSGIVLFSGGVFRPRFHRVRAWVDPWHRDWDW